MYKAERELRDQFQAILQTTREILSRREELRTFLADMRSLCILGCGSSFSVAKSSALQFSQRAGIPAEAMAAGDLLVNFDSYRRLLDGATFLLLSRSGSTSELLLAARRCREQVPGCKILSVCAVAGAPVSAFADVNIEIPWAFDASVCQTRTVSNLYASALLLCGVHCCDEILLDNMLAVREQAAVFCPAVESVLTQIGEGEWNNAVVLADSSMAGLAEEGALAFKEICQRHSNFYHVLDSRHGPVVMIDANTLVVQLVSRGERQLQLDLAADMVKSAGSVVLLECAETGAAVDGAVHIRLPQTDSDDVSAIFMLYCIQLLCLKHALARGVDPDEPAGLDPWIKLEI